MTEYFHDLRGLYKAGRAQFRQPQESAFEAAASAIGCEVAAIKAVFAVESRKGGFNPDGTVVKRFEPHVFAGNQQFDGQYWNWKTSKRLPWSTRERLFKVAFLQDPRKALESCSWGAAQIMGYHAGRIGYEYGVEQMVEALADSADEHINAFVGFINAMGLDAHLRTHDWHAFARRYNGPANADVYSQRIASEYERQSGNRSHSILRYGDTGEDVERLQEALLRLNYEVSVDGHFGPQTETAVIMFQEASNLKVDGIVGAKTAAALREAQADYRPTPQENEKDANIKLGVGVGQVAGVAAGATGAVNAMGGLNTVAQIMLVGAIVLVILGGAYWYWRRNHVV